MSTETLIEARNLWYEYEGGIPALNGIELSINRNEFIALIGANGSGKTTLVKHFNGLLKPKNGSILINGVDTRKAKVSELSRLVGFVFQNPDHQIFAYTVWEETIFGLKQQDVPIDEMEVRATNALQSVGLYEYRERHPRELSRGQRQRLAVASVLAMETDILVLDEPTTGQDFVARRQIMDLVSDLHKRGRTIVIVTHDMALVSEYCKRAIILKDGSLLFDASPAEVFAQEDTLSASGLMAPPIIQLAKGFSRYGFSTDAITLDELANRLVEIAKLSGSSPESQEMGNILDKN